MSDESLWYLKQVDLFEGIPEEEILKIAGNMIEKKCSKSEILYTPFDARDKIMMLKKGEVTLYYLHHGKKLIMDVLTPGSIFGDIHFAQSEGNHTHFAEVSEDAYVCIFEPDEFMQILQSRPNLMMKLLHLMSDRLISYERKMKGGLYDAKEKIIYQLESLNRECHHPPGFINKMRARRGRVTHERLAQLTGLSRETVTRAITALRKEGIIMKHEDGEICLAMEKMGLPK